MARPKKYGDLPDYMTFNSAKRRWVVRNPLSKKEKSWPEAERSMAEAAAGAVAKLVLVERQRRMLADGRPTLGGLVTKWLEDRQQMMPWSAGTRSNYVSKMMRIQRELGQRTLAHTDCMYLEDWIDSFTRTADTFNDWRYVFVLLWKFAVSRKLAEVNEAAKIEERSTSKKIESNKKQREPLDVDGFRLIHKKADPWLRLAMEYSLKTLLARQEICDMQHVHHRDGSLFVIRRKTSGDSDMAFIRIELTDELEELRRRSLTLDGTVSPYIIHRKPARQRRQWTEGKPHWTYINPDYLTHAFEKARDLVPEFSAMPEGTRPSFHEIRGLGSRLLADLGVDIDKIQRLAAQASPKTTKIYLEGGAEALTDDDFVRVTAPLRLRDILG